MTEIPDDVEMIARALNMRLHNAKTLGQRTLWIAEAILADRARQAASPSPQAHVVGWIYEDELPESYPYDAMFPYSKVDGVRLFPVYAPSPQTNSLGSGDTIMKADVEKMIRDWQSECTDHPALYNQGNVLLDRLTALKPSLSMNDFLTGMDCLAKPPARLTHLEEKYITLAKEVVKGNIFNHPDARDDDMRLVGFRVPVEVAGLSEALFALETIRALTALATEGKDNG